MWRRVWIVERKRKRGRTYSLRWHDDRSRERTESVASDRKMAERLRTLREAELNSGKLGATRTIRYEEFVAEELMIMAGRLAPNSVSSTRVALEGFGRVCRPRMLGDISHAMIEAYFSERLKLVAVPTANSNLRTLKATFNRAVGRGYLAANPAARVKQVREPERTIRVLTADEVSKLLEACPSEAWRTLVALAVTTGMRMGELTALRWCDVDLAQGLVHVRNTEHHLTKSRRNRVLGLFPDVADMLRGLPRTGQWVFMTVEGNPWGNNVKRDFGQIVKKAGIAHCSMHDLRRTFVSQLAMAGVNEAIVQKLAGHSSISTTIKHYTGIMPEVLRSAQQRLPFHGVLRTCRLRVAGESEPAETEAAQVVTASCAAS